MAATTPRVTVFWGAFLNLLIKCIAALGFATPARTKAAGSRPAAGPATVPAQAAASPEARAATPLGDPAAPPLYGARVLLPAPRPAERERSLPPTMKQRITAEAHGTSPSSRSIPLPVDGFGHGVAEAATVSAVPGQDLASDPAALRRDKALCG